MRSVQLDKALKELENSMKVKEHEVTVQSEVALKKAFLSCTLFFYNKTVILPEPQFF